MNYAFPKRGILRSRTIDMMCTYIERYLSRISHTVALLSEQTRSLRP